MAIINASEVKDWLKNGGMSSTIHDETVATVTASAIEAVQDYCGRDFGKVAVASETARSYGRIGQGSWRGIRSSTEAIVHDLWDTTNLVIKTDEGDDGTFETTWSASDYQLEPLNKLDGESYSPYWRIRAVEGRYFPTCNRRAALQVTAAWGWETVPEKVKQAALLKAAWLFFRKDSPQGVAGFGSMGDLRVGRFDPDFESLIGRFRHPCMVALVR